MNTAKITEKQQRVRGIITEMNQAIPFLLILNLLSTKQILQAGEVGYDADRVHKNKTEIVVSLKHLNTSWRTLNILLINC